MGKRTTGNLLERFCGLDEGEISMSELTRRDYFAAMALQGLLANPKLAEAIKKQESWVEESAWQWADRVLKLRENNLG
jgi:hypothetical protein